MPPADGKQVAKLQPDAAVSRVAGINFNSPSEPSNIPSGLRDEATRCLNSGDYPKAIEVLERIHRLDPRNTRILLDLGFANAVIYDFQAAERWFDKALQAAPEQPDIPIVIADRWMSVRRYGAAAQLFEQMLQQPKPPLNAFISLAKVYARQRRLDEAAAMADRALELHGAGAAPLIARATVHNEARQPQDAEKLLRTVLATTDCDSEARIVAWYELAAALDKQGRFDEAMVSWMEAKKIQRASAAQPAGVLRTKQGDMKAIKQLFTPAMVQRWRKSGAAELQPPHKLMLLGGHARSGTTLLEYALDAHSHVISADETSVFQSRAYTIMSRARTSNAPLITGLDWINARNLRHLRNEYFRCMESFLGQPVGDRWLIDKNPPMTFDIPAFCRFFPEAKYLIAIRDPRDVCLSCFMQEIPVLPDTVPWLSLEDTISHYVLFMEMWLAIKRCVGEAAIEVRYEDTIADLRASVRRVLDFLGLPWDEAVLRFHEHAKTRTICSPTYAEVTQPVFKSSLGRWKNYQKYFEPHLERLAPMLKALGYA